jgi:hypothetical protein
VIDHPDVRHQSRLSRYRFDLIHYLKKTLGVLPATFFRALNHPEQDCLQSMRGVLRLILSEADERGNAATRLHA